MEDPALYQERARSRLKTLATNLEYMLSVVKQEMLLPDKFFEEAFTCAEDLVSLEVLAAITDDYARGLEKREMHHSRWIE